MLFFHLMVGFLATKSGDNGGGLLQFVDLLVNHRVASWMFLVLAFLAIVLPLWTAKTLPTADGPSHVYNAFIASQTRAGVEPFASIYGLRTMPRANFATDTILRFLGKFVGWFTAERIWVSFIALGCAAAWFLTLRQAIGLPFAAVTAGWFGNSWFLWMGFYDFTLSLALFLVFSNAVCRWGHRGFWPNVVILLLLLYCSHLYTFAIATGLVGFLILWRVLQKEVSPVLLGVCVPFLVLIGVELALGSGGEGGVSWTNGWYDVVKAMAGWVIGDSFLSFSWGGLVAGGSVMAFVWMGLIPRFCDRVRHGRWNCIEVFILLSVLGTCFVPDVIGGGNYTSSRWRICTVLLALAFVAREGAMAHYSRWFSRLAPILFIALGVQVLTVVREADAVAAKAAEVHRALVAAHLPKGAWVMAVPRADPRQTVRIPPFMKVLERSALELELNATQNYEPSSRVFEVRWRRMPPRLLYESHPGALSVALSTDTQAARDPVWLPHDPDVKVVARTNDLQVEEPVIAAKFAVTKVVPRAVAIFGNR